MSACVRNDFDILVVTSEEAVIEWVKGNQLFNDESMSTIHTGPSPTPSIVRSLASELPDSKLVHRAQVWLPGCKTVLYCNISFRLYLCVGQRGSLSLAYNKLDHELPEGYCKDNMVAMLKIQAYHAIVYKITYCSILGLNQLQNMMVDANAVSIGLAAILVVDATVRNKFISCCSD